VSLVVAPPRTGVAGRVRPFAVYLLMVLLGAAAFLYPFWLPSSALPSQAHNGDAPLVAALVGALVIAAVMLEVRRGTMNGAMVAILDGDPSKEGFFTMRLKMPDGYKVPPHWHTRQERVTVLQGTLNLAHGGDFDPKETKALTAGTYSSMPPKMTHFAFMTGETILQLSTMGPWTITYVHPEDDPRKKTK